MRGRLLRESAVCIWEEGVLSTTLGPRFHTRDVSDLPNTGTPTRNSLIIQPKESGTTAATPRFMKTIVTRFLADEAGQTATEYMLIVSVVVIAVVAAAYQFVPQFRQGVAELASDVSTIMDGGCINDCDGGGGGH